MQRRRLKLLPPFIIASLSVLALVGCAPEASAPGESSPPGGGASSGSQPADAAEGTGPSQGTSGATSGDSGSKGQAEIRYGDTRYTAELEMCLLKQGEDALFHGTAFDDSGAAVGYLDGDFGNLGDVPYGEVRIDFGATEQFQSTDELIAIGDARGHLVVTDSSDTSLIIAGGVWDQNGEQLATGTLRVNC